MCNASLRIIVASYHFHTSLLLNNQGYFMYKLTSENREPRVKSYRLTTTDRNDPDILALRAQIKRVNADIVAQNKLTMQKIKDGTQRWKYNGPDASWTKVSYTTDDIKPSYRVRVMGRGPRASQRDEARRLGYESDLSLYLPLDLAEYFDVYVGHTTPCLEKWRSTFNAKAC